MKSEQAIESSQAEYKLLDKDWANTKKTMDNSFKKISKSVSIFKTINKDISQLVEKLEKLTTNGDNSIATIAAEIDALGQSTADKYAAAEASSEAMNKPSQTAALFLKAQNEASILSKDKEVLKTLTGANEESKKALNKARDVLAVIKAVNDEATEILAQQTSGLEKLGGGIASSEAVCREYVTGCSANGKNGIVQFKEGAKSVLSAQDRFYKVLQTLESDIKTVKILKNDLGKNFDRIIAEQAEIQGWADTNKLTLKEGKNKFSKYVSETGRIFDALDKKSQEFESEYADIVGKDKQQKNKNKALTGQVIGEVKGVQDKLDKGYQMASNAEKLFQQAKVAGDKEAAKYLRSVPAAPTPVPVPVATPSVSASAAAS